MARKATRNDVAKEAGVSPAAVSLVMSGRGDSIGIAKGTQERIRSTAQRLGYVPNSMMQSILRGRSNILGVFVGWSQWSRPQAYWMEITRGLQAAAAKNGQDLLIYSDAPGGSTTEEIFKRQSSGIVDGVLIEDEGGAGLAALIEGSHLPAIVVGWHHPTIPSVTIASSEGVSLLVNYLVSQGYKNLAYLDPEPTPSSAMDVRRAGFVEAVKKVGRPEDAIRMVGMESPEAVVDQLMALNPKPDAVVCFNDLLAYILLGACQDRNIDVPGQMAITGFDGIPVPPGVRQVTTVRSPMLEMCETSVELLLQVVDGKEVPLLTELHVTELETGTTA